MAKHTARNEKRVVCESSSSSSTDSHFAHPDHTDQIKKLNRVIGQMKAVQRMIEEGQYCPDILIQTRAAASALKAIEVKILESHLRHCVSEALSAADVKKSDQKIQELITLLGRF